MAAEFHVLASQLVNQLSEVHDLALAALRKENEELRSELLEAKCDAGHVEFGGAERDTGNIRLKVAVRSVAPHNALLSPESCASMCLGPPASKGDIPAEDADHFRLKPMDGLMSRCSNELAAAVYDESLAKLWWQRGDRFLVYPEDKCVHYWDSVITSALIITGIFTPFEIAFLEIKMDAVMVLNVVLWAIFVADMGLQCCLVRKRRGSDGLENITKHSELMCLYLRGWFLVDFVSVLPFGMVGLATGSSSVHKLKVFRVIRLLRMLKLLRVVRASRILARWAAAFSLPQSTIGYLKVTVILTLGVHWMGCVWGLIGREVAVVDLYSWIDALADEKPEGMSLSSDGWSPWNVYIAGLYYAAMTITSIGYGDIGPQQTLEYICGILFQCIGGMLWAVVIGTFCAVLTTADPGMIRHRQTIDELNYMMSEQNFDLAMQRTLRLFFMDARARLETEQQRQLLSLMSPFLRAKVAAMIHGRHLRSVSYISKTCDDFIASVSLCLRPAVYIQGEKMLDTIDKLCVLNRGVVVRYAVVKRKGSSWGDDFVLARRLQYWVASTALTFVEIVCLTASAFAEATKSATKEDYELIRKGILRLKFCRVLVINACSQEVNLNNARVSPLTKQKKGDALLRMMSSTLTPPDSKRPSLLDPSIHCSSHQVS